MLLIVESNHDDVLLRTGPYPRSVANRRIAGPHGHLSNAEAADLVRSVAHRGLTCVVLAHLSANCNEPALALHSMAATLARTGARGAVTLDVATQDRGGWAVWGRFHAAQPDCLDCRGEPPG